MAEPEAKYLGLPIFSSINEMQFLKKKNYLLLLMW